MTPAWRYGLLEEGEVVRQVGKDSWRRGGSYSCLEVGTPGGGEVVTH